MRDVHGENHKELSRYTRAVSYINRHAMERSDGKDIRIYQMQDWFLEKYDDAILGMERIYGKIHTQYFLRRFKELGFGFVAELLSYGYLAYLMSERRISVSEFVFSVGVVRTFLANFSRLIYMIQNLNNIHAFLTYIRKLLDLPEKEEKEVFPTDRTKGAEITFQNVSFRYPDADTEVLSHINITIHSNEKLALIGLNGAGKTTFVKLLCGFYKPTEGEIFVNGIPQSEYDRDEYMSLISALFQDSMLFPVTVDENLTGSAPMQTDSERLAYVLKLSGFDKRYESLSQGGETKLVREANENATDLSGGEKQKLLFARALYKRAPIMILDEPTAALDPIAENELYLRYGEAAKNRTVVFISHRLSSTRFCDRIALLEGARILEEGT
ncbi:MAG: ABC transporter ATP-binding protein/permease, partial [Lachnospiraceae bacterium]|nr:ABC transporter ATP-binding protein/permease [Lachnospiraceae bacterium]